MFKSVRALHLSSLVLLFLVMVLATSVIYAQRTAASTTEPQANDANPLKALQWRSIGPFRGGRVTAVAGVASAANGLLLRRHRWRRLEDD